METSDRTVRAAVYGTGRWANRTHIPSLLSIDGVEIVAPVLAGWESARRGGECLDVAAFMSG